ncbi:glycoside hydrolase family 26 protein [Bradyrhizobium genosp. P]|uniref:glycoside hydrolase family 26 protein n=1 Tax=Bradyrhizobium genosp. P TaxID=83641 RepID=UPI003CE6F7E8
MRTDANNRITRRTALGLAALAAGALTVARAAPSRVPQLGPDPARFAGAFVNWGETGREHMLQAWEKWLNRPPSSVLGVDFYGQNTWEDFHGYDWVPGLWKKLNPARNVVWSVPLTITGTPLADVAGGLHDADFEAAGRAIAQSHPKAIIRLGWEMNISSMGWFAKGQEDDYVRAFRRVVDTIRRHSGELKFDWCPGWGAQDTPADVAYPGNDVVDYVGLDVYDFKSEGSVAERWTNLYLKAPFGLQWQREFAAARGKLMSYPEWGVGHAGDNAEFVQLMHDWFAANRAGIAYAAYFDVDGLWPTQIDNGRFPKSASLFRKLFAG